MLHRWRVNLKYVLHGFELSASFGDMVLVFTYLFKDRTENK